MDWDIIEKCKDENEISNLQNKIQNLELSAKKDSSIIIDLTHQMDTLKKDMKDMHTLILVLQKEIENLKDQDTRFKNQMLRTKQPFSFRPETFISHFTFD